MRALCPGSFDPITNGHVDVIERAAALFDEVIVGVGQNSAKHNLLTPTDRVKLAKAALAHIPNVGVEEMSGLLVDFCEKREVTVIVKGLRFASDFDYELQMAQINEEVASNRGFKLETVLLPATSRWGTLSSTMVREVASFGEDISMFVPKAVAERLGDGSEPQEPTLEV
ncbi:MAG: pantetheine-phosphate adenylyltransferase [Propionibacteriaceae bacterium]|jgi:pantetheine-phosphate adenylyltransferase|nr:pantetheine-phosphate adenylyltransferase [Propionibacteriaceae bacterium]